MAQETRGQSAPSKAYMFRTSLRELLCVTAFFALSFAVLKYANDTIWLVTGWISLVLMMLVAVIAVAARGPWQGFGLGAVVCASVYGFLVFFAIDLNEDTSIWGGQLPTSKVSYLFYESIYEPYWYIQGTQERLSPDDARIPTDESNVQQRIQAQIAGLMSDAYPKREFFIPISHALWGMLFGYLGGRLGWVLTLRRTAQ